jgi:hypothetical protein
VIVFALGTIKRIMPSPERYFASIFRYFSSILKPPAFPLWEGLPRAGTWADTGTDIRDLEEKRLNWDLSDFGITGLFKSLDLANLTNPNSDKKQD